MLKYIKQGLLTEKKIPTMGVQPPLKEMPVAHLAASLASGRFFVCLLLSFAGLPIHAAAITIWKTVTDTVKAGEPFTYTIYVHNLAITTSSYGTMYDALPAGCRSWSLASNGGIESGESFLGYGEYLCLNHQQFRRSLWYRLQQPVRLLMLITSLTPVVFFVGEPITTTVIPADPEQVHIIAAPSPASVDSSATITVTPVCRCLLPITQNQFGES